MTTIVKINLFVFIIVCGVGIYRGLHLKKWISWLYGAYGFFSGFLIGIQRDDVNGGIGMGALFAFVVMYGGVTSYWYRRGFGNRE